MTTEPRFQFEVTWEDPGGARGVELRATWARLKIVVDERPVTSVAVRNALGVRDEVYGPLYPIVEWLCTNWWFLQHEPRSRSKDRLDYPRRHDLRFAAEGFYLPKLQFVPDDEGVRIAWEPSGLLTDPVRFIAPPGVSYLAKSEFNDALRHLVQIVIDRLGDLKVESTPLQQEWKQICDIERDPDAVEFCKIAAKLGQDPFAMDDQSRERIVSSSDAMSAHVISELSEVSTIETLNSDVIDLCAMIDGALEQRQGVPKRNSDPLWRSLIQSQGDAMPPWGRGYLAARKLRDVLGVRSQTFQTTSSLLGAMGRLIPAIDSAVILDRRHRNEFLDAVAVAHDATPRFFLLRPHEAPQRFALCRAIYRCAQPNGSVGLVTQAESATQAAGRAFAAEFLAPAELLRSKVHTDKSGEIEADDVETLADEFGVSRLVIVHQLENHRIARVRDPVSGHAGAWPFQTQQPE